MKDKRLLLIYAIVLFDITIGSIIWPVLPELVRDEAHAPLWLALGTGLFLGLQLFTAPLLGKLSDRWGRKPIFVLSAIGTVVANTILLPCTAVAYIINRGSDGLTNGVYAAVRSSITDISSPEDLPRNMGIEGTIVSLGFISGPFISGILLFVLDLDGKAAILPLIILAVVLSCFNVLLSFLFRETHQPEPVTADTPPLKMVFRDQLNFRLLAKRLWGVKETQPRLFYLLILQFFSILGLGYYHYFLIYIGLGDLQMGPKAISVFFIYMGIITIVVNLFFFTKLAHRIRPAIWLRNLAIIGVLLNCAYALIGSSYELFYALLTVDVMTIGLLPGIMDGLVGKETNPNNRGEIFGMGQLLMSVANIITVGAFTVLSLISLEMPFFWFAFCFVPLFWSRQWLGE